jgi:DNA-binding response OmpR family regulator
MDLSTQSRGVALVVEDNRALRSLIAAHLAAMGFEVFEAVDYYSAVAHLEECTPRLVCATLELPNESGYALCEYLRGPRGLAGTAILVMSEQAFPANMAQAEEVGANAFLEKPFTMSRFVEYVRAVLQSDSVSQPNLRRLRL